MHSTTTRSFSGFWDWFGELWQKRQTSKQKNNRIDCYQSHDLVRVTPERNPIVRCFLFPSLPQPQVTTNLLLVYLHWPILDTSYKWNHTLCGFGIWLLSLCCSVCPVSQSFKFYINFLLSSKAFCNLTFPINAWFLTFFQGERPLFWAAIWHSSAVYWAN